MAGDTSGRVRAVLDASPNDCRLLGRQVGEQGFVFNGVHRFLHYS
jgi:hypothetical protein